MITDHTKIIIANNLIQVKPKLPNSKGGRYSEPREYSTQILADWRGYDEEPGNNNPQWKGSNAAKQ